jgi:multiple sugar transport system ATP-binding protein
MAELRLEGVTKTYPSGTVAVRNLNLIVGDGELLVLVGPSGCGKSTTLRLVAGLENPTTGKIRLGERVVNGEPPRQRDVALVFQRPALYPHLSARDNLAFGLRLAQQESWWRRLLPVADSPLSADDVVRIDGTAELLGLTDLLDRKPAELSGGEQQRVALGRALVRRPGLLLLDEPLSNLDAQLRVEMRRQLLLLRRRFRATMLHVTHDQDEALNLGDRVAVLDRGELQQVDTPSALLECPANRFVAGFLGSPPRSFLDGKLIADEGGLTLVGSAGRWSVPESRADWSAWVGHEVSLALWPEAVVLRAYPPNEEDKLALVPGEAGRFAYDEAIASAQRHHSPIFEVRLVERHGTRCLVALECGGWRLTALVPSDGAPAEGQRLTALPNWDRACLFDVSSGRALSHGVLVK